MSLRWSEAFSRDSVPKAQRRIDELAMGGVPHLRCRHPRGVDRSLEELRVRETLCRSGSCRSFTPVSLNNRLHRAGSTAAEAVGTTASCAEWDIAGKWLSVATNNYDVTLIVAQHGTHLSGRAPIPVAEAVNSHYSTGTFSGTLIGRHFEIVVVWAPRSTDGARLHGQYAGTVVSGHIVKALGTDLTTKPTPPSAGWVGYGPTRCLKV